MPRLDLSTVDRETLPLGAAWLIFGFSVFVLRGLVAVQGSLLAQALQSFSPQCKKPHFA